MKLEDFWTSEKTVWQSLQLKAEVQIAAAQARLGDARGAVAAATARLQGAQAGLAQAKAKLAAETNLGDIPADAVAVRKQQALVNEAQGDIARASDSVSDLQAAVGLLTMARGTIDAKLAAAVAGLAEATVKGAKRNAWVTALGTPPLKTLAGSAGDAQTAKGAAPFTAVRSKLSTVLGSTFADSLGKRHDVAKAMRDAPAAGLDKVISEWTGQYATGGTPDGSPESVAAWTAAYERAFDALGNYVRDGKKRFDATMAALTRLAAADLASADEIAEFTSGAFTAEPARGNALTLATARDTAFQGYVGAVAAFERSVAHDLASDPDGPITRTPPDPTALATADANYARDTTAGDDSTSPRALSERRTAFLQLLVALQEKRVAQSALVQGDLLLALLRGDI